jgi:hypothetical protein
MYDLSDRFSTTWDIDFTTTPPQKDSPQTTLSVTQTGPNRKVEKISIVFSANKLEVNYTTPESSRKFSISKTNENSLLAETDTPYGPFQLPLDMAYIKGDFSDFDGSYILNAPKVGMLASLRPVINSWIGQPSPSSPVASASSSGGKTKEECGQDYKNDLKEIAGDALIGAGFAAAACSSFFGCVAGLVILGGTYVKTSSAEDKAKDKYDKCVKDAEPPA